MDRMATIELAIKNERAEKEYYTGEAKRSGNPVAKALFKALAADEEDHMQRLRKLHEKLTSDGSWPQDVPIEVADTDVKEIFKTISRVDESTKKHDIDDVEALKKSIEHEAEGSKLYAGLADASDNPQEKKFFGFLSQIEREHMLSMEDSLFYLEDPEGWFQSQRGSGLDGA